MALQVSASAPIVTTPKINSILKQDPSQNISTYSKKEILYNIAAKVTGFFLAIITPIGLMIASYVYSPYFLLMILSIPALYPIYRNFNHKYEHFKNLADTEKEVEKLSKKQTQPQINKFFNDLHMEPDTSITIHDYRNAIARYKHLDIRSKKLIAEADKIEQQKADISSTEHLLIRYKAAHNKRETAASLKVKAAAILQAISHPYNEETDFENGKIKLKDCDIVKFTLNQRAILERYDLVHLNANKDRLNIFLNFKNSEKNPLSMPDVLNRSNRQLHQYIFG